MTREEFIKRCALMGVGIAAAPGLMVSCKEEEMPETNFSGKVLIIGAGAAGMMAAYTLQKYNIDFELLEASDRFGGRVKMTDNFADFPIDLGAEWVHTAPSVFSELLDSKDAQGSIELVPYKADSLHVWTNGKLKKQNWMSTFYGEYKFKSSTWYQFFENHVWPFISDKALLNHPVVSIDYSGNQVVVEDSQGRTFSGDRIIVTVPLTQLKNNSITFEPALPQSKTDALGKTNVPDGIKVFFQFAERFYPDITSTSSPVFGSMERLYYDAAYRKVSNQNVLALFNVGDSAAEFAQLGDEQKILEAVMGELDEIFDGQASRHYKSHVIQNWSAEPYIEGSYTHAGSKYYEIVQEMTRPVNDKLYFAGEAFHPDSWSTVHGAGFSGISAVKSILGID